MEIITSRQNPLCTHLRKLAASASYRRQRGEFLCDSPKLLKEALLWGAEVRTVVATAGVDLPELPLGVRQVEVPAEVMKSLSPMETPQGTLFTCAIHAEPLPETLAAAMWCWIPCRTPAMWAPSSARRTPSMPMGCFW